MKNEWKLTIYHDIIIFVWTSLTKLPFLYHINMTTQCQLCKIVPEKHNNSNNTTYIHISLNVPSLLLTYYSITARSYCRRYGNAGEATPPPCNPPWTMRSSSPLSIIIRRKMRAGSGNKMSTRAALPHPQTWAESRLPLPPATSRSHHADPRQSSCDRRVFRSFPTFVLFGGQRRGRSAVETSCWGGGGGRQQLYPVALGARTRCCSKVCEESAGRRACRGAPQETKRGESDQQRG